MDDRGYIIIDGSRLFSSIHELWRIKPQYKDKKAKLRELTQSLFSIWGLNIGTLTRAVYYFKRGDSRIGTMLELPDTTKPGEKDHWQMIECGQHIDSVPEEELQKISPEYRDHFARSEKGLDIKLACDSLLLVSSGRASNMVFLFNDRDYKPLLEAIQNAGGNVYLTSLCSELHLNRELSMLCDKYLSLDQHLENIFGSTQQPVSPTPVQEAEST